MSDDRAFLQAIVEHPCDDTTRVVYADWLDEHNDPRAAFLRLQVSTQQSEPGAERNQARERLLQAASRLDPRWLAQVDRPRAGWRIVRRGKNAKVYGKAIPAFIHNGTTPEPGAT